MTSHLFPVFLVLNWIHSTAGLCVKHEVKAGVFAESTRVAQEGVFLVIVDGPNQRNPSVKTYLQCQKMFCPSNFKPAAHLHLWHW